MVAVALRDVPVNAPCLSKDQYMHTAEADLVLDLTLKLSAARREALWWRQFSQAATAYAHELWKENEMLARGSLVRRSVEAQEELRAWDE